VIGTKYVQIKPTKKAAASYYRNWWWYYKTQELLHEFSYIFPICHTSYIHSFTVSHGWQHLLTFQVMGMFLTVALKG